MTRFYSNIHDKPILTKQDLHAINHLKRIERSDTMNQAQPNNQAAELQSPKLKQPTVECPNCGKKISELWYTETGTMQLRVKEFIGKDAKPHNSEPFWQDFGLAGDCFFKCPECQTELDVDWLEEQRVI